MFHSHPGGTAMPSMIDVQSALEPEWMYLIAAPGEIRGFTSAMVGSRRSLSTEVRPRR